MAASVVVTFLALAASALAQFPAEPVGLKVLQSRFGDGVTITYKEVGRMFWSSCTVNDG